MTVHQHAHSPIGHTEEIEETEFFSCCNNGFEEIRMGLTYDGAVHLSWSETDACITTKAAASMLCEYLNGKSLYDAIQLTDFDMLSMLEGEPKCILLPWSCLQECLFKFLGENYEL